jgi:hypothetical protein
MKAMVSSFRRVGVALLLAGVLATSAGTFYGLVQVCNGTDSACLAASVSFAIAEPALTPTLPTTEASGSTAAIAAQVDSFWYIFFSVAQLTGIYIIMLAMMVLIALEVVEIHYIRKVHRLLRKVA